MPLRNNANGLKLTTMKNQKIKEGIKANIHNIVNATADKNRWFAAVLKTVIDDSRPVEHYKNLFRN